MNVHDNIKNLGPWWEYIYFDGDNVSTNGGRKKTTLLHNIDKRTDTLINIKGKRILDIGCNGGGLMLELSKRGANVVGIDVNDLFINQAKFVKEYYNLVNCEVKKYNICNHTTEENIKNLGHFDIICFFGIIYHLHKENNESILRYIYEATDVCLSSSQITPHPKRNINWKLSKQAIDDMILNIGYEYIETLILDESMIGELTNAYYFKLVK